jgi:hypothetical protein
MQVVPQNFPTPFERHIIISALASGLQSWFADTLTKPIFRNSTTRVRQIDTNPIVDDRSLRPWTAHTLMQQCDMRFVTLEYGSSQEYS